MNNPVYVIYVCSYLNKPCRRLITVYTVFVPAVAFTVPTAY